MFHKCPELPEGKGVAVYHNPFQIFPGPFVLSLEPGGDLLAFQYIRIFFQRGGNG